MKTQINKFNIKFLLFALILFNIYQLQADERNTDLNRTARGDQFRKVVERTLPADILRLILRREFRHVDAVGRDVVRGAAERNDGKDGDRNGEERR